LPKNPVPIILRTGRGGIPEGELADPGSRGKEPLNGSDSNIIHTAQAH